jgi:alkylated DNA repair protein (DNA oxidative demethylase)
MFNGLSTNPLTIMPGAVVWPGALTAAVQVELMQALLAVVDAAPWFQPVMPRSGRPFSVQMTNCGALGWVSDRAGYRYQPHHPDIGARWPAIPGLLRQIWAAVASDAPTPEACLINHYTAGAKMGLHQDRDEQTFDAPVVSVSLGDPAVFRIGPPKGKTHKLTLNSGDVLLFGGPARLARHGIDRVLVGRSDLVPGGGRINVTLRRVTVPNR